MKFPILILGVCIALLAVFFLPTAQAGFSYDANAMTTTIDQAVTIQSDDSGGSLVRESIDELAAWYPGKLLIQRRRSARANGRWYPGKLIFGGGRAGSC